MIWGILNQEPYLPAFLPGGVLSSYDIQMRSPGTIGVESSTHNRLIHVYIAISYLQVETTLGISANPRFKLNACSLAAEVRKGYQVTALAFLTFRVRYLVQRRHLPAKTRFLSRSIHHSSWLDKTF